MPLDIIIVEDVSKPYWENEKAFHFGEIDPREWGSLFFTDFDVMDYGEYSARAGAIQSYENYYSNRMSQLKEKSPMIIRIKNYYEDAFFSRDEIEVLRREILSLKNIVKRQESMNLLDQLLEATEIASKNDAGLQLEAD